MGFIERAFTPPGTGGREAAMIQSQADLKTATTQLQNVKPPPSAPTMATIGQSPAPPPTFTPGQAPGAKKAGGVANAPTSMLGAAAASGNQAKKSLLGQ